MKNLLILICIVCTLEVSAQNYLISFEGTGLSTTVSSVKIENLTKGTFLNLNGDDILHLSNLTGVNSIDNGQSSELKIWPNPMTGNSVLQVFPPSAGEAIISALDITGKLVFKIPYYLENSPQEFRLSGLKSGYYLISVKGSNYQYSGKLLCNTTEAGTIIVQKISSNQTIYVNKTKWDSKGIQSTVDMAYTTGDRLKFTGISGNYSTVKIDIPSSSKTITFNFIACSDVDNNNYPVVEIGTQVWMAENLKTSKYRNGDLIGTTTPATLDISQESTPKYQWAYDGNENNVSTYGRLYTWFAVIESRNLCPTNWHVPTSGDLATLTNYLENNGYGYQGSGSDIAKSMAAASGWTSYFSAGTVGNDQPGNNASGFTALPSGFRYSVGSYDFISQSGFWWSSTEYDPNWSWNMSMDYSTDSVIRSSYGGKWNGSSVRCVRD
jgi:uncharacterized protein (TIGR02145 family)